MRRVPSAFQLMGHTIKVQLLSAEEWRETAEIYPSMREAVGYWYPEDCVIFVLKGANSMQLHRFVHELLHAALDALNHPSSADETLVDNLAGLLTQALLTAR